jgi:hypothetical protein
MPSLSLSRALSVTLLLGLGGCSLISPDTSAEALKANAHRRTSFHIAVPPEVACHKTARMLMWCAGGPSFHYRCSIANDNSRSELTGSLEAIYHNEYFMVTEFIKESGGSNVTVHQRVGVLIYDYAPRIEALFTNPDCLPR